jgi:hypothetical protein
LDSVFTLDFVPDKLLVRTEVAAALMKGAYPKIVAGMRDTGKTITAKWLAAQNPGDVVYVQCQGSLRFSLRDALGALKQTNEQAIDEFFSLNGNMMLILDDVQKLMANRADELDKALHYISDRHGDKRVVVMTNLSPRELISHLMDDTQTRYRACERVVLTDYDLPQAEAIIRQRFEIAGMKVERGVTKLLAEKYAGGDFALRDIFRILDSMYKNGTTINMRTVEKAIANKLVLDFTEDFLVMPVRNAVVLGAVSFAQAAMGGKPATRGAVINGANRIFDKIGGASPSTTTFGRIIDQLLDGGYLNSIDEKHKQGRPALLGCAASYRSVYDGFLKWLHDRFGISIVMKSEAVRRDDDGS